MPLTQEQLDAQNRERGMTQITPGLPTGGGPIGSSDLVNQPPIRVNEPKFKDIQMYDSLFNGGRNVLEANAANLTPQQNGQDQLLSQYQSLVQGSNAQIPNAQDYQQAYGSLNPLQSNVQQAQQAQQAAQDKYNALQAQLQQYNYNASTLIPNAVTQSLEGTGATTYGQSALTEQQLRKNALAAAPVQFNALIAQGELASAQGRTQLAQGILEQAQNHLDKMYQLQVQDAQNQYNAKRDFLTQAIAVADKKDAAKLQKKQKEEDRAFELKKIQIQAQNQANQARLEASLKGGGSVPQISPYQQERAFRTTQSVNELSSLAKKNPGIFGKSAAFPLPDFARSAAFRDFRTQLDTLKSNIAFGELTAMREASKTGGALGAVSDREINLLESALGALNMSQSPESFIRQLEKVNASITRWQNAAAAAAASGTLVTAPDGEIIEIID